MKTTRKEVAYTLATHAAENLRPSREAVRYCEQISAGRVSADQAVENLLARYGFRSEAKIDSHGQPVRKI